MDTVNKDKAVSEDASAADGSVLEISTNNQDDTLNYQTADEENSSKYFSMITDSTLEGVSSADVTLESKSIIDDGLVEKQLMNRLTNIQSKSVDKLQIHEKIDAAKILSGGVDIFDDNENSNDEHGLVIDYDAQAAENVTTAEDDSKTASDIKIVTKEISDIKDTDTKEVLKNDIETKSKVEQMVEKLQEGLSTVSNAEEKCITTIECDTHDIKGVKEQNAAASKNKEQEIEKIVHQKIKSSEEQEIKEIVEQNVTTVTNEVQEPKEVVEQNVAIVTNEVQELKEVVEQNVTTTTNEVKELKGVVEQNITTVAGEVQENKEVVEQDVEKTDNYSALLQSNLPEGSSEVTLLIDDKNVDAIDIGEGVFIYKNDDGELTAIQITMNEDGTTNFKCLHVGKNEDGNLEVYEEQVSQVPVTTEELESMRSQELANKCNTPPVAVDPQSNICNENKEATSNISQKEASDDVVSNMSNERQPNKDLSLNSTLGDQLPITTSNQVKELETKQRIVEEDIGKDLDKVDSLSTDGNISQTHVDGKVATGSGVSGANKVALNKQLDKSSADSPVESDILVEKEQSLIKSAEELEERNEVRDVSIAGFIVSKLKTATGDDILPNRNDSDKTLIKPTIDRKQAESLLQENAIPTVVSPVNVCGVATKISDPVLPAEIISDSQDSTSNILSAINNEESSNTVESVVSSCPSINPTDSIISEQLSMTDTLCTKLSESKALSFEISNLRFKGESGQSASLSEELSQGESIPKSISDEEISNDSNIQPLVIEDNSMSQDVVSEASDIQKKVEPPKSAVDETLVEKEVDNKAIDDSAESQTSMESDDDEYAGVEPVTGDSGMEWNNESQKVEQKVDDSANAKVTADCEIIVEATSVAEVAEKEVSVEDTKNMETNISDNNNDISKTVLSEKENDEKSKPNTELVIKEVDFDKFVRRNSIQMFEECVQVDYEDVAETIKTKSVPIIELESKPNVIESPVNNVHNVVSHKVTESVLKVQHTSPIPNKSSKSLDESILYLSNVAEKTPSPKRNVNTFRPNYSPVENNRYMNKSSYSAFVNQIPKHHLPNAISPSSYSPTSLRRPDVVNAGQKTYMPVHKSMPQNSTPLQSQKSEKVLGFSLLNEKQSAALSSMSQQTAALPSVTKASPENLSKQPSTIVTPIEKTQPESPTKSSNELDLTEAQKMKNRQPRKQVFTPVTRSDMEMIFPNLFSNAQEYKKETDAKALKLKKEQDLKFKQLSKKEQSRRNEKTNKTPPNKPVAKVASPARVVEKNVPKDLSTPILSYQQVAASKSPVDIIPAKSNDKPLVKGSPNLPKPIVNPEKMIQISVQQQPCPVRNYNETVLNKDDTHSLSPIHHYDKGNDSPRVSNPHRIVDKPREQHIQPASNYSSIVKDQSVLNSPVKNTSHEVSPSKSMDRKSLHMIDLPSSNLSKSVVYANKFSNHHGTDNSRVKESVSPRTYSRFMNKQAPQNVYHQTVEPSKRTHDQLEPFPKLTDVLDKKVPSVLNESRRSPISPKISKDQSPSNKVTEINLNYKETNNQKQTSQENLSLNTSKDKVQTKPTQPDAKKCESSDKVLVNKSEPPIERNNIEKSVTTSKVDQTAKSKSSPISSPSNDKKSPSNKNYPNVDHDSQNKHEANTPSRTSNKTENSSPLTDSIKRKRGRPKKMVADSPVVATPKMVKEPPKSEIPVQKTESVQKIESPTQKADTSVPKKKHTPKDNLKVEEKSRASSISPFGKIDENIKCPICFKTFRTHNVLIKHVKHCNGTIEPEVVKSPKKRKLTDSMKSEDSMESERSECDRVMEDKAEDQKSLDSSNDSPSLNRSTKKLKTDLLFGVESKTNIIVPMECDDSYNKSESHGSEVVKTINLEDSILDNTKIEKSNKDIGKNKIADSPEVSKNDNIKKKLPGRPPKDRKVEEAKQDKQAVAISPMSRLSKILSTKPPPNNSPIACTVCGKTFRQLVHMVYHRSSKHNVEETDVPIESSSTNNVGKSKPEVEVVATPAETADTILKCEICHKGFRKLHHLVEHREMHANSETKSRRTSVASVKSEPEAGFRCETCDKSFRKLHHLVEHRELHLAEITEPSESPNTPLKMNEPKPVEDATCPGCGKSFRKRHHMVEHRDVHCSPSKKGKSEDGSSTTDTNIRLSVASSNSDEGNNCGICGKSYRKLHHMVEHRESHAEVKDKKSETKTHPEPEHLKDIIHECSRCYMVFPNENALNKHIDICSKKRLIKKSFNFSLQDDESVINLDETSNEKPSLSQNAVECISKQTDADSDKDIIIVEPTEQQKQSDNLNPITENNVAITSSSSESASKNIPVPRVSSDSKSSVKSQKSDRKSIVPKDKIVPKCRKSTLTKETISSRSRKSVIPKHSSSSSDNISVISRTSSLRKSSISSESVSSKISLKRKSSSSIENIPLKKLATKDVGVSKPAVVRKSLDSAPKNITKAPNRRSLNLPDVNKKGEEAKVKYKLNESIESDVKYKINPEFSKSIKRLSQSSADSNKSTLKLTTMKVKTRRSESALSGFKITKEKILQTITEETNVLYSFPKKTKTVESDIPVTTSQPTTSQPVIKKPAIAKQPVVSGRRVVVTKKTNIVVANKRKSLGGRKSIEAKKLPGIAKRLQLRCCSQVFGSQADLAVHRKTHKDLIKVHKCDCGKTFDTEGLLKRHIDIEHTPPKSYKCAVCGVSVRTAAQYAKHKRDHETEQKTQKSSTAKKLINVKKADKQQTKIAKKSPKAEVPTKSTKVQPGKSKSPITETRKGVKRKVAHGGVPLSDKMRKAIAGDKF